MKYKVDTIPKVKVEAKASCRVEEMITQGDGVKGQRNLKIKMAFVIHIIFALFQEHTRKNTH